MSVNAFWHQRDIFLVPFFKRNDESTVMCICESFYIDIFSCYNECKESIEIHSFLYR